MLLGYLLYGLLFGTFVAAMGLWFGLSILSALVALVIGSNLGLAAGLQTGSKA